MKRKKKIERGAEDIEDQVLVDKILAGDNRAFERLVEKYKKKIYYLAYRMTRDHDLADELAQESFVRAYQALSGFKRGYSFYTWIYRICINLSINFLKRDKRTISTESMAEAELLKFRIQDSNQLERMITSEQAAVVKKAMKALPPDQKAAFILRVYENLPYEKIAEVMGCSIGTVMSRLYRARYKLKKALEISEIEAKEENDEERM